MTTLTALLRSWGKLSDASGDRLRRRELIGAVFGPAASRENPQQIGYVQFLIMTIIFVGIILGLQLLW